MSRNRKVTDPESDISVQKQRVVEVEVHGVVLALFGVVLLLSLVAFDRSDLELQTGSDQISNFMGMFGAWLAHIFITAFGLISYVIALGCTWVGVRAILRRPFAIRVLGVIAPAAAVLFAAVLLHLIFHEYQVYDDYMPGGVVGGATGDILVTLFNRSGTLFIACIGLTLAVFYLVGITIRGALRFAGRNIRSGASRAVTGARESAARRREAARQRKADAEPSVIAAIDLEKVPDGTATEAVPVVEVPNVSDAPDNTAAETSAEPIPVFVRGQVDLPSREQQDRMGTGSRGKSEEPPPEPLDEPAWATASVALKGGAPIAGHLPVEPESMPVPPPDAWDDAEPVTKFDIMAPDDMERRHADMPAVGGATRPGKESAVRAVPITRLTETAENVADRTAGTTEASGVKVPEPVNAPQPADEPEQVSASRPADLQTPSNAAAPNELSGPAIIVNKREKARVQEDLLLPPPPRGPWEPPSLSLLDYTPPEHHEIDQEYLRSNAEKLEAKLLDYKVQGKVVGIHPGPVVTMYEFLPAAGVRISQIANLADDLTMALKATSIRIVAPIPGKGVVGIEVPNKVRETVYLREILASDEFSKSRSKLTIALGKDIFGNPVVTDLARMPHLLIAGATGSGKSVAVNAFILSLLRNATPEEVRIILVDPKVVELNVYEDIPHLLLPVVCDPKQAAAALRWACEEMDRRYSLLAHFAARNIASFNMRIEKLLHLKNGGTAHPQDDEMDGAATLDPDEFEIDELVKLPYIVIVLDEFADLMMVASKDVEAAVTRLAQKARAAGIHLIMATQRPSKEVITGLIKSNFPSRIGFRVSGSIDSRIILDQSGAEALLGYGDMLFLKPGTSALERVHGSFVSDDEVMRVVNHLKTQGEPDYQLDIIKDADEVEIDNEDDDDPLTDEAQDIVLESGKASISFLQRRLKIGYNRSARIMESLERRRVVGPPDSRGERKVLI